MGKEILFNKDVRNKMKTGVDKLADSVKATLGPMGRNVAIRQEHTGQPKLTKDGVTVARSISLTDKFEDMGAQLVKMAAVKTATSAGDGTTTSTVLAQVIISEGMKSLETGANPVEIKKGMDKAVASVVENLALQSKKVTPENLKQIATVSANNDDEIGEMVAKALHMVGEDGVVHIQESKTEETYVTRVEGIQIDKGYISNYFVTNVGKMAVEFDDAMVLLYTRKISLFSEIETALNISIQNKKPLLIIAEDVDGEALAVLVRNRIEKGMPFAAIKLPGFGNMQEQMLEDIAAMLGGRVVSPEQGHVISQVTPEFFGRAKKIVITSVSTGIVGGHGKKEKITERIEQVKSLIEDNPSEFEKDKLRKQRLAKLVNGVAVIHVGAQTEVEAKEKLDRIDDAKCATIAAMQEGYLPGGGTAYIRAISCLPQKYDNAGETIGLNIIKAALRSPLTQIALNAGIELDVVSVVSKHVGDYGYNAKANEYGGMYKFGIIDPTKVARVALENAASVGAMFLTTEAGIVEDQPIAHRNS